MQTVVVVEFLSDEDECVSGPCQHDSKCHVDGTSYKCECTGAWEGTTCSSKCYYSPLRKRERTGKEYGCFRFVRKTKMLK